MQNNLLYKYTNVLTNKLRLIHTNQEEHFWHGQQKQNTEILSDSENKLTDVWYPKQEEILVQCER
jgi:hypothetical protein